MSRQRYTEEFKVAAVRQVTIEGHSVPEVAKRLGTCCGSLREELSGDGCRTVR